MKQQVIEWGFAEQPLPGETESGDRCVAQLTDNRVTVAVIDGLGHGSEAAVASRAAVDILESFSHEPILPLFKRCHERLRSTRGAAMTLARFDADTATIKWLGAGNVRAIVLSATPAGKVQQRELLVYSGAVGVRLPTIETSCIEAGRGDMLILATDGINDGFAQALKYDEDPQQQANRLLTDYWNRTDDAMILVARVIR